MHKTLERQLRKVFGERALKSLSKEIQELAALVSETYEHFDEDRAMIERSLELSSHELSEKNARLERTIEELQRGTTDIKKLEDARTATLSILQDLKRAKEAAEASQQELEKLVEKERLGRAEVERLNKFMIGRELKMVELKKRIKELESTAKMRA